MTKVRFQADADLNQAIVSNNVYPILKYGKLRVFHRTKLREYTLQL